MGNTHSGLGRLDPYFAAQWGHYICVVIPFRVFSSSFQSFGSSVMKTIQFLDAVIGFGMDTWLISS